MSSRDNIKDTILPLLEKALTQGFRVFVLKTTPERPNKPISFAYLCLDANGSFVTLNAGNSQYGETTITAPVKPHQKHGSAVLVDHGLSVQFQLQAMREVCESPMVTIRWVTPPQTTVPNYGNACLLNWPGGISSFVELTADGNEKPVEL